MVEDIMGFIKFCQHTAYQINLVQQYLQNHVPTIMSLTATNTHQSATPCPLKAPLVVTIVGLPCRGKSLAAHKIARHLCWKGEFAKVEHNATDETMSTVQACFQAGNNVAIIDGMHLTRNARQLVTEFCSAHLYHHLFVEFDCDSATLQANVRETANFRRGTSNGSEGAEDENITCTSDSDSSTPLSATDSDWIAGLLSAERRMAGCYERCTGGPRSEGALISVQNSDDAAEHAVTARGVQGALQTCILGVLSSPMIRRQLFYFSRHGESDYNVLGRIGGDADLSTRGRRYAERLTKYLTSSGDGVVRPSSIWTSELCRTIHTVEHIPGRRVAIKDLNEINAGICESLTYEEIQERFPQEFAWRDQDKLKYRYPHGESYLDLLQRVDNVVLALLTDSDVLVVSHQAVLRCIIAYFNGSKPEAVPYINVPLHTLLVVRSYGYNFRIETVPLQVECVDTYRIQPKNCSPERTDADALDTVPVHFDTALPQVIN